MIGKRFQRVTKNTVTQMLITHIQDVANADLDIFDDGDNTVYGAKRTIVYTRAHSKEPVLFVADFLSDEIAVTTKETRVSASQYDADTKILTYGDETYEEI
jgi:hypothetical protein